jgi:SAM-dependent methyltransferase
MNETSKSKKIWGALEASVLRGTGIDIGCGPDPVTPDARRFDVADGDASHITRFVHEQFDFVYSSHCLEHLPDPRGALQEWWQLVKPGGHLFFTVPDEDLYEQGVFPSRFNPDHRATFTISKPQSWSPVSVNVRDLASALPDAEIVRLVLQDHGYDHRLRRHGPDDAAGPLLRFVLWIYYGFRRRGLGRIPPIERWQSCSLALDQTLRPDALAQIQCILRKRTPSPVPAPR